MSKAERRAQAEVIAAEKEAEMRAILGGLLQTTALRLSSAGQYLLADEFGVYGCAICEAAWQIFADMPFDPVTGKTLAPPNWAHEPDCALKLAAERAGLWEEQP